MLVEKWVQRRHYLGAFSTLLRELCIEDPQQFRNFIRMSAEQYEIFINIGPHIVKRDTKLRAAISVKER